MALLANCSAVDNAGMDSKANDAPRALIHDDQHPMCLEDQRFTAKEVYAPKTVFAVGEEREPGRPVVSGLGPEMIG